MTGTRSPVCIYCARTFAIGPRAEGDHVIPAVFGEFVDGFRFYRVCPACNTAIAKCEDQVSHCGIEAVRRHVLGIQPGRAYRGSSVTGAQGRPPPQFHVLHPEGPERIEPGPSALARGGDTVRPALIITKPDLTTTTINLNPHMNSETLGRRLDRLGISRQWPIRLRTDQHYDHYRSILGELYSDRQWVEEEATEPGTPVTVRCSVGPDWDMVDRAVAKIAFHYLLCATRTGLRGDEPEFEALRQYIRHGGPSSPFWDSVPTRFVLPRERPERPMHLLAVDESRAEVIAAVALLTAPDWDAELRHIRLGRIPAERVLVGGPSVHAYVYDRDHRRGKAGYVRAFGLRDG